MLLLPLAAMIFLAVGRHPIAGLAAAFAGVSGGYSANLLLGTIDPLLAGLTQEAAHIVDPSYAVNPAANYYFLAVSTFLVAIAGTWVTERMVVPRLGDYTGAGKAEAIGAAAAEERRGLARRRLGRSRRRRPAGDCCRRRFLRDPKTGGVLHSPFSPPSSRSSSSAARWRARLRPRRGHHPERRRRDEGDGQVDGDPRLLHGAGLLRRAVRRLLQLDAPRPHRRREGRRGR